MTRLCISNEMAYSIISQTYNNQNHFIMNENVNKIAVTPSKGTGCFLGVIKIHDVGVLTFYFEVDRTRLLEVNKLVIQNELTYGRFISENDMYYSFDIHESNDEVECGIIIGVKQITNIGILPNWTCAECCVRLCEFAWNIEFDIDAKYGIEGPIASGIVPINFEYESLYLVEK